MRRVLILFLALLTPMTTIAQQTLASLRETHRVLLVFAPGDRDPRYRQQVQLLAGHEAEMRERDLVPIPVLISVVTEGSPPETLRGVQGPVLSSQEQTQARQRFQVAPQAFAAILLGKDGGEKLQVDAPVSIDRLNRTIDAMPMRKGEMRAQKRR